MKNIDIMDQLLSMSESDTIHKEFDFGYLNGGQPAKNSPIPNCGTAGCLAGELPGLDPDWYFDNHGNLLRVSTKHEDLQVFENIGDYFGLPDTIINAIFMPNDQSCLGLENLTRNCSLAEAQDNGRKVLAIYNNNL